MNARRFGPVVVLCTAMTVAVTALAGSAVAAPPLPAAASVGVSAARAAPADAATKATRDDVAGGVAVAHHVGRTFDFDRGWRFALVNTTGTIEETGPFAGAPAVGYDDSGWRQLDLPHDWSIEQAPSAGPGTNSGTGFLPGGLGWYRKTFTLPAALAGERFSVEFDGIYMDSSVYLNGELVARHPYGYTGFSVPLAGAHADGRTPNVIAVQVRNQVPSSRWYSGSGIYRNVRLVATGPVHVARWGTSVSTPGLAASLPAGYADVAVHTKVDNDGGTPTAVRAVTTVRDARGRPVGSAEQPLTVGADGATADATVRVRRPVLWDVDRPYLYTASTRLLLGAAVVDSYVTRFGIRYTTFDPQRGFALNGRYLKFYGVNLHHDQGALGAVVNSDAIVRQLTIMKSMGVNAVRTSHNPPTPELVEACDRLGLLLMVEAFDVWNVQKVRNDYARFFDAWGDSDITEMVNESKNSPAVIMWSIGNEIPNSTSASGVPIARRLIADVRAADPTRPVVIGSDKYRRPPTAGSPAEQVLLMLDGVGLNYNTAASVDVLHARYPGIFFFESESSSETSTRGRYDQPEALNTGEDHTPGRRGASSFDNNLASWTMSGEYSLKKDRDRSWFLGQFLWSGTDYIGEPTPFDTFPVKTSFFGAVDTAGFPKDQYYLFQSRWTDRPMVHLVPMDTGDPDATQIWAYSNVDTVELFRDGRSLGVRRFDHKTTPDGQTYLETTEATGDDKTVTTGPYPGSYTSPNGSAGRLHLTWSVPAGAGRLVAVARRGRAVVARDVVEAPGSPAAVRLTSDRRAVAADGRSLAYLTAQIVDARGMPVPTAENLVRFSVAGGRLVGVDNGREESAELYKAPARTAFAGKALGIVQAPAGPGRIRVTATSPGLRPATVTVAAAPSRRRGPSLDAAAGPIVPPVAGLLAGVDASFTGSERTPPAAMVDGDPATAWSDAYVKDATALLPSISAARPRDWVSLAWPARQSVRGLRAQFVVDATRTLPATVEVRYWTGRGYAPVRNLTVAWSEAGVATVTFDPVATSQVRLDLTSSHPQAPNGFLGVAELSADVG